MAILSKNKKKYPKMEVVPDDPENLHLSKAEFVKKQEKRRNVQKELDKKRKELMSEDSISGKGKDNGKVEEMESELKNLVKEASEKETMANSKKQEEEVKKLKKKIVSLRMRIGKEKKK